ncbi:hypothetical protein FKM82_026542 [Ascaphus truei]
MQQRVSNEVFKKKMHFHFLPASEIARTPGKTVTFSKSDSPEEAVSPPVSSKKQPASNKTPAKVSGNLAMLNVAKI